MPDNNLNNRTPSDARRREARENMRRRQNIPPNVRAVPPSARRMSDTKNIPGGRVTVSTGKRRPPAVRRPTELENAKQRTKEIKRQNKIVKYKTKAIAEAKIERERNIGVVRVKTNVDRVMLALILTLLCLGTIMVFSASYPSALAQESDSLYYIKRQAVFAALGIGVMIVFSMIPYQVFRRFAVPVYILAIGLLLLVLVIGQSEGAAKRWLGIPYTSFSFQPSEFMKLALVLMLAWYLEKNRASVLDRVNTRRMLVKGIIVPFAIVGAACVLVLLEKHLSGTIIIGMIGIIVMLIGGTHAGWTFGASAVGGAAAISLFLMKNSYALQRITTKMDENADNLAEKWQTTQGLYAIGSGGLLGVGLGASRQKYSYVSAAQNDFIFTIWCEEMGFIGALLLIGLFLLFIWRGYKIAMHAPDTFAALTVFGITSKVGIQAFLNIAVVCDIIPNTGVALPFFSYGGSSLIFLMIEMGIVLSISKHSYQKK